MFSLNTKSSLPIYEQLQKQMVEYIAFGLIQPGDQLPAVRALARDLGVNPNTIQKAYQECERLGYIYSVAGKGSFVSEDNQSMEAIKKLKQEALKNAVRDALQLKMSPAQILELVQETIKETTHD